MTKQKKIDTRFGTSLYRAHSVTTAATGIQQKSIPKLHFVKVQVTWDGVALNQQTITYISMERGMRVMNWREDFLYINNHISSKGG
jgi:hypothetical protein